MNPHNTAQAIIERSIYQALRVALVATGYFPDPTSFADTAAGEAQYRAALKAIADSKGFAAELFGSGSIGSKGQLRVPRIVMDWAGLIDGDYGMPAGAVFEETETGFTKKIYNISTHRAMILIYLVSDTTAQERLLHYTIQQALPSKIFLPYYTPSGLSGGFYIFQESGVRSNTPQDQLKEFTYQFSVPDIYFEIPKELEEVTSINSITLNTEIAMGLGISEFTQEITL